MIHEFVIENSNAIIFVSHQWLGWTDPDPMLIQYRAINATLGAIVKQMHWRTSSCFCWVDYHSVPQLSKQLQTLAIKTLPFFASLSSIFVIVAPETVHDDTGIVCDFSSYKKRMWCRAEVFSYYCHRGVSQMYLASEGEASVHLASVDEELIADAILVF